MITSILQKLFEKIFYADDEKLLAPSIFAATMVMGVVVGFAAMALVLGR